MVIGISAIAAFSFIMWKVFGKGFSKLQTGVRRFFLFLFMISLAPLYFTETWQIKSLLVQELNLNYIVGQAIGHYKGTDWADGLLTGTFFFVFVLVIVLLWNKEKKDSKKPDQEKPFKIEARIGNVKD